MSQGIYEFRFRKNVHMSDVETALALSVLAAESIYGKSAVELEGRHRLNKSSRNCIIEGTNIPGSDLARIFTGYLSAFIGWNNYSVHDPESPEYTGGLLSFIRGIF